MAYKVAAALAPDDPIPVSNLSAVKYELGHYVEAAELAEKAIAMPSSDQARRDKLLPRVAKCHLHELKIDEALAAAEKIAADEIREPLVAELRAVKGLMKSATESDPTKARKDLLDRLPRYKPGLYDQHEYYAVGHDVAEPLFDESISWANQDISLLFCGTGDSRNVFLTLLAAAFLPLSKNGPSFKSLHLTLLDLKPAALARTVLIFELMTEYNTLAKTGGNSNNKKDIIMASLAFLYVGHVYPSWVQETIQDTLVTLINRLEGDDDSALFSWLYVPQDTRAAILYILKQWHSLQTAADSSLHDPGELRDAAAESLQRSEVQNMMRFGPDKIKNQDTPKGCEDDLELFENLGFVAPPERLLRLKEPELQPLIKKFLATNGTSSAAENALDSYLDKHWKTNVTLVDADWEAQWKLEGLADGEDEPIAPNIDFSPVAIRRLLVNEAFMSGARARVKGVIGQVGAFFEVIAQSIDMLAANKTSATTIEMVAAEMTDFMERLQYDLLDYRKEGKPAPKNGPDPSKFPKRFDRMHLSNIPDYVGGIVSPAVFARPLLKQHQSPAPAAGHRSNLRFIVLLNSTAFHSHEQFQSEYMLMPSAEPRISSHFGLRRLPHPVDEPFYAEPYIVWELVAQPQQKTPIIPWAKLMNRGQLEKWLYGFFLKTCLPYPRPKEIGNSPVYSPFNLTIFLRLVARMHEVGYPAHWLSSILSSICSGTITTTARAPRSLVMTPEEVAKVFSPRKISVKPWTAEFTTVLGVWRPLLPFGVTTAATPSAEGVVRCSLAFPILEGTSFRCPHFMIVFWNLKGGTKHPRYLRNVLLDDELGDNSQLARDARESRVHIVTVFRYVTETRTATFWLRKDVVDELVGGGGKGDWTAFIGRTDTWEKQNEAVKVAGSLVIGESWA